MMSLEEYREKRKLDLTPEPSGKTAPAPGDALRFVVQKHRASHLHYDLRLELNGVMKSWAVPKGPSLNPGEKRLAVKVEDHPVEYRTFEGVIPPGNYGSGEVIVWDEGTYHVPGAESREDGERILSEMLEKGHASFILEGSKLRGEFALVELRGAAENAWLLLKKSDEFASPEDVTVEDRSVVTGRTIEEIRKMDGAAGELWLPPPAEIDLSAVPEEPMPRNVAPMLAVPVKESFDRTGWVFEIKWDGYRAIAEVDGAGVRLYSRNLHSFNARFPRIVANLARLGRQAVLDGEIVVVDETGRSQFQLLQNYQKTGEGTLIYYVFDLLHLDGHNLTGLPLTERRRILALAIPDVPVVRLSDYIKGKGVAFYGVARDKGLEGIMAKNGNSPYLPGRRTREWLKIKIHLRQGAVIGGFTEPRGGRKHLGALVLGVYDGRDLVYAGHVGGGFDERGLAEMRARLELLEQDTSPFRNPPRTNAPVHWVTPELVCEVKFQEWTEEGLMRQPVFIGLREDKPAKSVRRELPRPTEEVVEGMVGGAKLAAPKGSETPVEIGGRSLEMTNLDKVYWPEEGHTKGDLIEYYRSVARYILPHLKDRPESLHRHPDGIYGQSFFHKNVEEIAPEWAETVVVHSEGEDRDITYYLCQDEAALAWLANLGCIEINPWLSRFRTMDYPDYLAIDLDPVDIGFDKVMEAALAVKETLEEVGACGYCKTSGATGMHVYVPLGARYSYDQAKQFAQIIAYLTNRKIPSFTSIERMPEKRRKMVYVDFLQNRRGQTLAAPYSVRPRPHAPVSTPVRWEEVKPGLDPSDFTVANINARLERIGDIFSPVLGEGIDLVKSLRRLEST